MIPKHSEPGDTFDDDEFIKHIEEDYINELMENEAGRYTIDRDSYSIVIFDENECLVEDFSSMSDFVDHLNDKLDTEFRIVNYREVQRNYPDTLFLTNKAAQDALRTRCYHFSADAHSYAMTALYSPEVEKLWDILRRVDFTKLRSDTSD